MKLYNVSSYVFLRKSSSYGGSSHLTDAQVEELCRPLIDIFEQYAEIFAEEMPDLINEYPGSLFYELPDLYYGAGEYELCAETREWLYEMTSNECYREGGIVVNEYDTSRGEATYDRYGRIINSKGYENDGGFMESNYEYGENGKLIKETFESNESDLTQSSVTFFEYDSQGRIAECTHSWHHQGTNGYSEEGEVVESYVYTETGYTEHWYRETYTANNTRRTHATESWSSDYEIVIDESDGSIDDTVSVGEIYNDYHNVEEY